MMQPQKSRFIFRELQYLSGQFHRGNPPRSRPDNNSQQFGICESTGAIGQALLIRAVCVLIFFILLYRILLLLFSLFGRSSGYVFYSSTKKF